MIEGHHVALRAIERSDLPHLLAWRNQPTFRRYFREFRELGATQQERWYETTVLTDPRTHMFAITDRRGGMLIGACGLCYVDWVNRTGDFSLYVGRDGLYIDDVYAADAGALLLTYGFDELGLHRVWCEIYEFDQAKQRLLPRLGFTLDGRHRETHWAEGAWHDSLFFGILDREFRARRADGEKAA
jgi:RimJ/RimL family protein N-acetyltransferase